MSMEKSIKELMTIPSIGKSIALDLWNIGITSPSDLKGKDPEVLFDLSNGHAGMVQDRCLLYSFRCAVYYCETEPKDQEPEKLKWWNWKDSKNLNKFKKKQMSYTYDYPHFALTVDAVIFSKSDEGLTVLLIRRAQEPFKDCWAFPGGYVNIDEVIDNAVYRELKEETSISTVSLTRFDIFDAIDRDPRERTVSVVYYGFVDGSNLPIKAGDDAKNAKWFPVNALPELAFDHAEILKKILEVVGK